jgi:hypothetical protein
MRLEFGVGVRADFAVEVDLFVLRCGPFHGRRSFSLSDARPAESITGHKGREYTGARPRPLRAEEELLHIDKMRRGNSSGW